jgi:hypothetical protein
MVKKRYHHGMHDSESMRVMRPKHHMSDNHDAERRHEYMQNAGMIREDHSKIANLPQQYIIQSYPKDRDYMPEDIDDTIRVWIDRCMVTT